MTASCALCGDPASTPRLFAGAPFCTVGGSPTCWELVSSPPVEDVVLEGSPGEC